MDTNLVVSGEVEKLTLGRVRFLTERSVSERQSQTHIVCRARLADRQRWKSRSRFAGHTAWSEVG